MTEKQKGISSEDSAATPSGAPADAPPFFTPPIVYGPWRGLSVAIRTSPRVVRQMTPEPLVPDASPWGSPEGDVLVLALNDYEVVRPFSLRYRNACVMVPASYQGRRGMFTARMFEDGDDPTLLTIWGRETWGFPKLAGRVEFDESPGSLTARLQTFTSTRLEFDLRLAGDEAASPPNEWTLWCRKTIPSPEGIGPPDVDSLVAVPWRQSSESRRKATIESMQLTLDPGGSPLDLADCQVLHAAWSRFSPGTKLDAGTTVHRYSHASAANGRQRAGA